MEQNNLHISNYPVLALRGLVCIPGTFLSFDVVRKKSISAINKAMEGDGRIFVVCQKILDNEEPSADNLYNVGVIAHIKQILKLPGDVVKILIEGETRSKILSVVREKPFLEAEVCTIEENEITDIIENEASVRLAQNVFGDYADFVGKIPSEIVLKVLSATSSSDLSYYITANLPLDYKIKQEILEIIDPITRIKKLVYYLEKELDVMQIEQDIHFQVRSQIEKNQRDYYIREQIKVLENELGDGENEEIFNYKKQINKKIANASSKEKLLKEVDRLARLPFGSQEGALIKTYIETCLSLPWSLKSKEKLNLEHSKKILDNDHYGLEKVKQRILELIAVKILTKNVGAQIICLVGPPGVGKTSIAESIARSMGRKYVRISLGGVRDEAEIRGHRKTYLGSMPGRIISAINQAGTSNPLILLDEIDKLSSSYNGDPSSALLEVLDPEQNKDFKDHFIEIPFDLSDVVFITTANTLDTIQRPLLDRMEVIELSSYTYNEKLAIAKEYLIPKQLKKHGILKPQLKITDAAISEIITSYTREAGVRTLERHIATICRKTAKNILNNNVKNKVDAKDIEALLGAKKYKDDDYSKIAEVGVANGLAYTSVGGEMLSIEVNALIGTGKLELTGSLGDVMKESCKAAISYIRSKYDSFGLESDFYKTKDIHIHFPEGAVPKDGPSAGITITTAIVSELTGIPVRYDVAMTGEVTLRGKVLPIGGLREKTMAALKNKISTVIIPKGNEGDITDLDDEVKKQIKIIPVSSMDEVLKIALTAPIVKQTGNVFIPNTDIKTNKIEIIQ